MLIHEITDMLRREARALDDKAVAFTQEGIVMREAAHKLEELQRRKEMQNAECRIDNPSVSFADSSRVALAADKQLSSGQGKQAGNGNAPLPGKTRDVFSGEDERRNEPEASVQEADCECRQ